MTNFNYKKWITENKYGKNLYEQGVADFYENSPADFLAEQTGSGTGSGNPSTGGPTPTGSGNPSTGSATNNSHENFTGTICNCVGDCSGPGSQIGVGFQAGGATHQCNGQMCVQSDIGQTFDYDDGTKTLTFTLDSFNTPGIFGVSQTPGINMPSSTCPTSSSLAPICHYCDTGSGSPIINSSTPAYYSNTYNFSNGYSWNSQGDCYTGNTGPGTGGFLIGNLSVSTVQSYCVSTPPTGSGCDVTPNSPCAQLHFGNNASNFANYMSNQSCATFQSNKVHQIQGAYPLAVSTGNNGGPGNAVYNTATAYTFLQIKQMANTLFGTGGAGQPQKGQFKRKAAKAGWCQCMQNSGCCTTNEGTNLNENKDEGCGCSKPKPPKSKLTNSLVGKIIKEELNKLK